MIPLRLRSSRSIRTHPICASCCTHVAQSAGIRGHAIADPAAGNTEQDAKPEPPTEPKNKKPAPEPQASSSKTAKSTGRTKKTPTPRKGGKTSKVEPAGDAAPAAAPKSKTDETVELWKETLDILKSLQIPSETPSDANASQGGGAKGDTEKRSLRSQFAPIPGASSKAAQRQAKLLEGTLDVLKNVLTIQADQRAKSGKPKDVVVEEPQSQKAPERRRGNEIKEEEPKTLVRRMRPESPKKSGGGGHIGWDTKRGRNIKRINTSKLALKAVDTPTAPVPRIAYDLDRVLFNEGVYVLQDPRSKVFNFDPYLSTIMPVDEFDFDALKQYVTSSKDELLIGIAKENKKMFTGSTSSMTSTLAHFHYLLSAWRPINPERMSKGFVPDSENFGAILRAPAATFLHYKDGTYAIDADKEYDSETILSSLGKSMEKLLTVPKEEFEKYRRTNSHQLTEEERNADESYHYTTFGDFMMRSQLDAYDPRLPGSGVYDLKTRAVVSIRMDATHHEKGVGYEIRQRQGQWESFEREYYDMIRLAFLKYSLQVRMGRMDGIFVAYHNTERIFGFQYVPLEEMDLSIHGTTDLTTGSREFMASLQLWEEMLKKASEKFPEQSLRVHVETRPSAAVPFMYFFAEPVTTDEIKAIQEHKKEDIAKFQEEESDAVEEDVVGKEEDAAEDKDGAEVVAEEEDSEDVWEDMMEAVEETMENDAEGITAIREAIEEALEESGLLHAATTEEAQRYVEALLKSIVDVDTKTGSEAEEEAVTESSSAEVKSSQRESGVNAGSEDDQSQASTKSPFGFLSSWFGAKSNETRPTANEEPVAGTEVKDESKSQQEEPTANNEQDQTASSSLKQALSEVVDAGVEGTEQSNKATKEAIDGKSDDSLKDLIVKLTSRVGLSSDASKATEELSEDQAKLRKFESILLEMIPKTQEQSSEPTEDTADVDAAADEVAKAPSAEGEEKSAAKPVLGLILTIRNNVNNRHVQRPENLTSNDKWNVEYTLEEIPEDKAQSLYESMKKRRHRAFYKEPNRDFFAFAFNGMLKHYTRQGRNFREKETRAARDRPTWVVGQSEPLENSISPDAGAQSSSTTKVQEEASKGVTKAQLEKMKADQAVFESLSPEERLEMARSEVDKRNLPEDSIARMWEKLAQPPQGGPAESARDVEERQSATFKQWREENTKKIEKEES
ncbi:hypothetical protein VP1G_00249 [Cytospora mali]|uniref:mRNA degradation protein pet127, mitochondrial n=1 Tax=Cytospora mali TaxID=578113 RepID=A0A194UM85_CYTMA|nr:hypothetical protein VP1G_00249 [Valsa mali var. pyri (nom. inval.)]